MKLNAGTDREVTVRLFLASEEYGRETFEAKRGTEMFKQLGKLIRKAIQVSMKDGVGRQVGILIIPKDAYESHDLD